MFSVKGTTTIKILLFVIVFAAIMSVSFLVEAHDMPNDNVAMAAEVEEVMTPDPVKIEPLELHDMINGLASWYGADFHGRRTASGRRYNMNELTAAHKSLPFGTLIRVVNEKTGNAVVVEVTDRGPFIKRRVIDLSKAAAQKIGVSVTPVELEGLTPEQVARFYASNDSAVIGITSDMSIVVFPNSTLTDIREADSYSKAVASLNDGEVVVVKTTEKGKPSYAIARIAQPDELAYVSK